MKTIDSQFILILTLVITSSYLFYILTDKINAIKKRKTKNFKLIQYIFKKLIGFFLLGFLPATIFIFFYNYVPWQTDTILNKSNVWLIWMLLVSLLLVFFNLFNAKRASIQARYPELNLNQWDSRSLGILAIGWIVYLIGYEYLFRGIFLNISIIALGMWPAVILNLAIYSSLHLYKGIDEAIASIPFGAFMCYLTIESNSVIPAILVHAIQAVSNEFFCIYRNHKMNISMFEKKLS
jgi:membrane protease YdiL (CAAX protease family)